MHGAEYDEMCEAVEQYRDKFDSVAIAEPLLGEVGEDATVINADKEAVAAAIMVLGRQDRRVYRTAAPRRRRHRLCLYGPLQTLHTAKVSHSQMETAWAMTLLSAPLRVSPSTPPPMPLSRRSVWPTS